MDEYEPLRQFLALSGTLHFGRAARASHLSPSALSRSIQRLEDQVGEPLFDRQHHRVSLTPAGEAFRHHALAVLGECDRFASERASSKGVLSGTVRIYCTVTAAQSIVPDLLAKVRRKHPMIRLALTTGYASDAIEQLRGGAIDVSVAALPDRLPAGILSRVLLSTPVVFVCPKIKGPVNDAIERRVIDWSTLPIVLPAHGLAREYLDQWIDRRGITPNIYSEIEGHEAILSLVALGCGVGVVPRLVVEKSALRGRISEFAVKPSLRSFRIALCVRDRSLSNPVVGAVWEAI